MCVGELYQNITLCVLPEVSAVHVCITPHSINVTLIVKSSLSGWIHALHGELWDHLMYCFAFASILA